MSIDRLSRTPSPIEVAPQIDISDEVAVSIEALRILGFQDLETVSESLKSDLDLLRTGQGRPGEFFVQIPLDSPEFSLKAMIDVIDGKVYDDGRKYPKTYIYDALWAPGTTEGSYTTAEINSGNPQVLSCCHARLAINDGPAQSEPLIHFPGQPFDEMFASKGELTQVKLFLDAKTEFDAENPEFYLESLNAASFAMLALLRRIKGEPMPISWGAILNPYLIRTKVDRSSLVGCFYSNDSTLKISGSYGYHCPSDGIGLSVGINETVSSSLPLVA